MPNPLDRQSHYAGAILFDGGSQSGWTVVSETVQCVHCQRHWSMEPGSGRERGWCRKCMGPICGAEPCFTCVPAEKMLEMMEAKGRMEANLRLLRGI